jgi:hypothetical protein
MLDLDWIDQLYDPTCTLSDIIHVRWTQSADQLGVVEVEYLIVLIG